MYVYLHPSQTYLRALSSFFILMHSKWKSRLHSLQDLKLEGVPPFLHILQRPVFFRLFAAAAVEILEAEGVPVVFPVDCYCCYCAYLVSKVPIESFLFGCLSLGFASSIDYINTVEKHVLRKMICRIHNLLTEIICISLSLSSLLAATAVAASAPSGLSLF